MLIRSLRFAGSVIQFQAHGSRAQRLIQILFGALPRDSALPVSLTYQLIQEGCLFQVYRDGELELNTDSEGALAQHLLERASYHYADRCRDGLVLHAACLAYHGRGLLLPGITGSGKSTLAGWLVQSGFELLSDELAYLPLRPDAQAQITCQGLNRPLNLKISGLGLFPEALSRAHASGDSIPTGEGEILPLRHFWNRTDLPGTPLQEIPLTGILFPCYQTESALQFTPLSQAQTGLRLMECLINARNLPDHGLSESASISRVIPGFELTYPRFIQILPFIKEALGLVTS